DEVPAEEFDIEQRVSESLGIDEVSDHFLSIEKEPLAAASIGQVHRAVLKDGTQVILKFKRRGVEDIVRADLSFLQDLVKLLRSKYEAIQKINLYEIVQSFSNALQGELSFTNELNNVERFRRSFRGNKQVYVPKIYRTYSNDELLCMEFIESVKIN